MMRFFFLGYIFGKNIFFVDIFRGKEGRNFLILIFNKEFVLGFLKFWEKKKIWIFKVFFV